RPNRGQPSLQGCHDFCIIAGLLRGGAVWQLVGLITRRSQVQILPPLPRSSWCTDKNGGPCKGAAVFVVDISKKREGLHADADDGASKMSPVYRGKGILE